MVNKQLSTMKKLDFQNKVLPLVREIIKTELTYFGVKNGIKAIKEDQEKSSSELTAVRMLPNLAARYPSSIHISERFSSIKETRRNLEKDVQNCNDKIRELENVADNINEIVQYLKSSLFGLLNPILEDEEAFLKPADIMNFREFRIELLYLIAIYQPQLKIVTMLLSCNSCETLAGLFPEIKDLTISDSLTSVEEKIKIFYQKFYDMDIRDL